MFIPILLLFSVVGKCSFGRGFVCTFIFLESLFVNQLINHTHITITSCVYIFHALLCANPCLKTFAYLLSQQK